MTETTITTVDGRPIDYDAGGLIPQHMRGAMQRYIENRIPPGSFLTAVLANDLMGALRRADHINRECLHDYGMWLANYAPPACYGSPEAVRAWLNPTTT
jgi:hypothetical protein